MAVRRMAGRTASRTRRRLPSSRQHRGCRALGRGSCETYLARCMSTAGSRRGSCVARRERLLAYPGSSPWKYLAAAVRWFLTVVGVHLRVWSMPLSITPRQVSEQHHQAGAAGCHLQAPGSYQAPSDSISITPSAPAYRCGNLCYQRQSIDR